MEERDLLLIERAKAVRERAYAPYSKYKVGAAIISKRGNVYVGCNVENASFGAGICAERVAIGSAVAAGEREFDTIAIVTESSPPAAPCGICRQVLSEFNPKIRILLANTHGEVKEVYLHDIFKEQFRSEDLGDLENEGD